MQVTIIIPRMEHVEIVPLIEDLLVTLRDQFAGVAVKVIVVPENLSTLRNCSLLVAHSTQYVDNAAKDCVAGSTLVIRDSVRDAGVAFSVRNGGPTIPHADFERIFDRYYRCSIPSNEVPGTGIGLSIANRTAQAQGGYVSVTNGADRGSTFYASLPTLPPTGSRP
jgi:K+-sensing histidine kinase KdpD